MTTISTGTATVDGVGVRGACLGGEVHKGLPTERGGGRVNAAMDDALREIAAIDDGVATFAVRAELTVHPTWPTSGPSRSGEPARRKDEEPRLLLDGPALEPGEVGQIAMVEEDGILRFVLPMEGTRNQFDIPLGDSLAADGPGERGLSFRAAALAIRVVGVLGGRKLANAGFRMGVRAIEDRDPSRGLRTFLSTGFRKKPDERTALTFSSGPSALLLLHGINSSSHSCFRFSTDFVQVMEKQYGGRVIAFDHPTLGYSPAENAGRAGRAAQLVSPRERGHPGPLPRWARRPGAGRRAARRRAHQVDRLRGHAERRYAARRLPSTSGSSSAWPRTSSASSRTTRSPRSPGSSSRSSGNGSSTRSASCPASPR